MNVTQIKPDRQTCAICPRECSLAEGETGNCRARRNVGGRVAPLAYGRPCAVAIDPMEKKPLYHFRPGKSILSIGTAGCNLHCLNCQNSDISQVSPGQVGYEALSPCDLVSLMERSRTNAVAYTYNEPLVAFEYVLDCAKAVRDAGGENVLVSAGYVNEGPLAELLPYLDAANIDLKTMSEEGYLSNCGVHRDPVLKTLKAIAVSDAVLEVTDLVIPGFNDSERDIREWCAFVAGELGSGVPVHFSRFFPRYRMIDRPPTPLSTLSRCGEIAKEAGLEYVYIGNVDEDADTFCPSCGTMLIKRRGFDVLSNAIENNRCPGCGREIYGRF
ncbi:MAG: AmmeMemoRadiSam system radical SAM enzyme [Kiritimatiellae bacterium]|nr:AmmeMemoRadiSam system radical SAM enzyme [Kiritimatiellia bacterium]